MTQPTIPPLAFSRLPAFAVGGAIALAITLAAIGQSVVGGATPAPSAALIAERTLSFVDRADHAVLVRENGRDVAVFEGEQGFIRGILRGMNRQRRGRDVPRDAPFHLAAYADGRLTFEDPSTGVRLDMAAFGVTNEEVFATLLPIVERKP